MNEVLDHVSLSVNLAPTPEPSAASSEEPLPLWALIVAPAATFAGMAAFVRARLKRRNRWGLHRHVFGATADVPFTVGSRARAEEVLRSASNCRCVGAEGQWSEVRMNGELLQVGRRSCRACGSSAVRYFRISADS